MSVLSDNTKYDTTGPTEFDLLSDPILFPAVKAPSEQQDRIYI